MNKDLTQGPVMRSMLLFAVPMILGNLLSHVWTSYGAFSGCRRRCGA